MKRNVRIIFLLGLAVIVLPLVGVTNEVKQFAYYLIGAAICLTIFFIHKQLIKMSMERGIGKQTSPQDAFVENIPHDRKP